MDAAKETNFTAGMREMQAGLERLERREWWRWAAALLIMLLLTLGVLSLSRSDVRRETFTAIQLDLAVRGLLALVLVFDGFAIYQQVLISRLRRQLTGQIGMMAAWETLKPASLLDQAGRKERRRSLRYSFDQRVKIKTTTGGKEAIFFGRTIDLSAFGLGAVLPNSLVRGEEVSLEFSAGLGKPILRLSAIVRYANGFRHGFEFADVGAADAEHLRRACRAVDATTTQQAQAVLPQATTGRDRR
jgi:PilZ domain